MKHYSFFAVAVLACSTLLGENSFFPYDDIGKIQQMASDEVDLVVLTDGTQLKGRVGELPSLQFSFGKISIPTRQVAAIAFSGKAANKKMQVITRDGYRCACKAPNEMVLLSQSHPLQTNFTYSVNQEINAHTISYILFKNVRVESVPKLVPVFVLGLKNGEELPVHVKGTQILLGNGWKYDLFSAEKIVDVNFDGGLYGVVEGDDGEEVTLDFSFVNDKELNVQSALTSQLLEIPWDHIVSLKRVLETKERAIVDFQAPPAVLTKMDEAQAAEALDQEKNKAAGLQAKIKEMEENAEAFDKQFVAIQEALLAKDREIAQYISLQQESVAAAENSAVNVSTELEEARRQIEQLEEQLAVKEADSERKAREYVSLEVRRDRVVGELQESLYKEKRAGEALRAELDTALFQKSELSREWDQIALELSASQEQNSVFHDELVEVQGVVDSLRGGMDLCAQESADKYNSLEVRFGQVVNELEEARHKNEEVQARLAKVIEDYTFRETELAEQINLRQQALKKEKARVCHLQQIEEENAGALVAKQFEVEALACAQVSFSCELTSQGEMLKQRAGEVEMLEKRYASLEREYEGEKTTMAAREAEMSRELASLEKKHREGDDRTALMMSEIQNLQREKDGLKAELQKKTVDAQQQRVMISQLTDSLHAQQEATRRIERDYKHLVNKMESARAAQVSLLQELTGGGDHQPRPSPAPPSRPTPELPFQSVHVVADGESLTAISMKYYNTTQRWADIFEANRDVVSDVNNIRTGTALIIPE